MKTLHEQIAAHLLDDLPAEEQVALERRLAEDPAARRELHELTAMNSLLFDHHARQQASPTFEQRMVAGFRDRASRRPTFQWLRLPAVYFPATAGALAALVTIGALLTREHPSSADYGLGLEAKSGNGFYRRLADPAGGSFNIEGESLDEDEKKQERQSPQNAPAQDEELIAARRGHAVAISTISGSGREVAANGFAAASAPLAKPISRTAENQDLSRLSMNEAAKKVAMADKSDSENQNGIVVDSDSPDAATDAARKLIRNASVELEVARFDAAAQSVADLARAAGGYVTTQNSARLPNGKMSGALVVKVPPPALDGFLKQLRALGEVRNQTLGTEDVTKAYFDTDARLKNARVMEQRLVELLRDTKGRVSDLLEVERELGRVREQIEQMQGELKLWDALVAFATVNVQLAERDMDKAAAYSLHERATLALAATDVEAAFAAAKKIAEEEKAQVTQSNVTRDGEGSSTAVLALLVEPDASDATIERLRGLGSVLDFRRESERVARDGDENAPNAKVDRAPVALTVSIRSQDQSPTQRTRLRLETNAVEKAVAALRQFAAERKIEIKDSSFSQQPDGRQAATLRFLLPLDASDALLAQISGAGAVKDLTVERNDAPRPSAVAPRAEITLTVTQPPRLVADENGLAATLRRTFAQAVAALAWSVRMIGVALAFLAPWLLAAGVALLAVKIIRRRRGR